MATATHIELSTADAGVFHVPDIKKTAAAKGSEVLQASHDKYHCFFNPDGFHNHIPHHILTIYALGADAQELQKAFDTNKDYQRSPGSQEERIIEDMKDRKRFLNYLGKEKYYIDFLRYFQSEIAKNGVGQTFQEHVFAGDDAANAMLGQLFSGFLHPIIHAGFGIEFNQPAIVAEGLAMCAVSSSWIRQYFDLIDEHISKGGRSTNKTLFDLLDEIQANDKLAHSARWEDGNKIRDGVLARAPTDMVSIASQWRVSPDDPKEIEKKTAEMTNFAAYFTAAAQNPQKQVKMDFYFMHCINSSIFYTSFLQQSWLTDAQKAKLLEMKAWIDLAMYVSRNSPKMYINEIKDYKPKAGAEASWDNVIRRVDRFEDDGHTSKFIRALANGERVCKPYEAQEGWAVQGDMWLQIAHMVMDSVEGDGAHWARSVGFPEAWKEFADRRTPGGPSYESM